MSLKTVVSGGSVKTNRMANIKNEEGRNESQRTEFYQ